jgi:hypothetical protein
MNKTEKELMAEIAVHEAAGATRKVELLQRELNGLLRPIDDESFIGVNAAPNPVIAGDKNEVGDDVLYEYHTLGSTWAEIEALTGVKSAWFRVKKYAEANNLKYPIK